MPGGISLHVVDTVTGRPAAGMRVEIWAIGRTPRRLAAGRLGANGTLAHPVAEGADVRRGVHEARFFVGPWYKAQGTKTDDPPFLGMVPFRFAVADAAHHYHLPLKLSPWGYALHRGA